MCSQDIFNMKFPTKNQALLSFLPMQTLSIMVTFDLTNYRLHAPN